jgi:rhodanese-related sulfurtransferase
MRKFLTISTVLLLIAGMSSAVFSAGEINAKAQGFFNSIMENDLWLISPKDVAMKMDDGSIFILDIRLPAHWDAGHIEGSTHIPLTMLPDSLDILPDDMPIAVVCAMDTNSAFGVMFLQMHGYEAWIVKGGVPGWVKMGKPLVKE